MADQPDQKQPGATIASQEALKEAIELWDKTPVSILDQQAGAQSIVERARAADARKRMSRSYGS